MNYYELGAGIFLGASIVGAFIYLHIRVTRLESQLIQARQKNADTDIVEKVHKLSSGELDGLLGESIGRSPKA